MVHPPGISLHDFSQILETALCAFCGEFGGFVSLLPWIRCCYQCIRTAPETQVDSLNSVRTELGLTDVQIRSLRSFRTLPGFYDITGSPRLRRDTVVSLKDARLAFEGEPKNINAHAIWHQQELVRWIRTFNFMAACALPSSAKGVGYVEHGMSCLGCLVVLQLVLQERTKSGGIERAYRRGCDRVYSQDSFLQHFKWCEHAQALWRESDQGRCKAATLTRCVVGRGLSY